MKEGNKNTGETLNSCPACGAASLSTKFENQTFPYGESPRTVMLVAKVGVRVCEECHFEFTDGEAEEVRHEAVCRHLGVMPPRDIRALRELYSLSRANFAAITKIGEASLARWETGQLIQNAALDQFLYLLQFQDNLERLMRRNHSISINLLQKVLCKREAEVAIGSRLLESRPLK